MGDLSWRFDENEYNYIKEVLDTGFASSTSGNMNAKLEENFAKRFGHTDSSVTASKAPCFTG